MKKALAIFLIVFLSQHVNSQELQKIPHCPSGEIYDIITDKKGFIWIAHNLGVSRYDGISFTSFSNPEQSSLSATDLIEDNYGRIWFHNFNGQIFYIKDDKMVYLKQYDFKVSFNYPRIVLYGDELVATTQTGLFVCNTATLQSHYERVPHMQRGPEITSLCVINNTVLAYGGRNWYTYKKGAGLKILTQVDDKLENVMPDGVKLQPHPLNDTVMMADNRAGILYGLNFINNNLKVVFKYPVTTFLNTVSIFNNKIWLNSKPLSFSLDRSDSIAGYNLSSMVEDREGNRWYASLSNGLLVKYRLSAWKKIELNGITGNDYIQCLQNIQNAFVLSSRDGKIMLKSNGSNFINIGALPEQSGITDNIQVADSSSLFIESSNKLYLLKPTSKEVSLLFPGSVKDVAVNGDTAFLALSTGVQVKEIRNWKLNSKPPIPLSIPLNDSFVDLKGDYIFIRKFLRCRALIIDSASGSLLISYTDGLHKLKNDKLTPVLYKNQPLYVSSMAHYKSKIYAGSFNNGLFVIDSNKLRRITNDVSSSSEGIVKIKRCNNHIWIFRAHDIEVLDAEKETFLNIYPFPTEASEITDVEEDSDSIYLATHQGLYVLRLSANINIIKNDPTLLYTLVNNRDTIYRDSITLNADKNNLLFKLAIPEYKDAEQLHFKYRLMTGDISSTEDSVWYYTQDAQRDIQFNALKPGSYSLEVIAIKDNEVISNKPLLYHFTIDRPWYNTWWFYVTILLSAIAIVLAIYQYRLRQIFKIEHIRRKISNDLHDDIGSSLSSINVYSQLAKTGKDNVGYIDTIQTNAVSIINNLDDLVWNINPKNDALEYLINRMRLFAQPILGEKDIECVFKVKTDNPHMLAAPNVRADIYMLFKEIINNVIKHSGCSVCSIYIIQKGRHLRLTVKDNGRGFNTKNINPHRNGLRIMGERVKDIKGSINIHSLPGSGTKIRITCWLR